MVTLMGSNSNGGSNNVNPDVTMMGLDLEQRKWADNSDNNCTDFNLFSNKGLDTFGAKESSISSSVRGKLLDLRDTNHPNHLNRRDQESGDLNLCEDKRLETVLPRYSPR